MKVRIYVEGGGQHKNTLSACRSGFAQFFEKIVPAGQKPKVIACGRRDSAFQDFCLAMAKNQDECILLLVDSEGPVNDETASLQYLTVRDGWGAPVGATDDQAHLMVQCMESWFLADRETLAEFYGQRFLPNALPGQPKVEQISKRDVLDGLENASRLTQKGPYHKTDHGFRILALIHPGKVRVASPRGEALCQVLVRETNR